MYIMYSQMRDRRRFEVLFNRVNLSFGVSPTSGHYRLFRCSQLSFIAMKDSARQGGAWLQLVMCVCYSVSALKGLRIDARMMVINEDIN